MINSEPSLAKQLLKMSQLITDEPLELAQLKLNEIELQWQMQLEGPELIAAGVEKRRQALFNFFYQQLGFCADRDNYYLPAGSNLNTSLATRSAGPMILGLLLIHLAEMANISLHGINFPSDFILNYQDPNNQQRYFDPYSQEHLNKQQLQSRLRGILSQFSQLEPKKHLRILSQQEMIQRFISVNKASYIRSQQHYLALRCNELLLEIEPDDPYEIRDRGFLFEQLDCHQLAVKDYEYFLKHCPDDPAVPLLKLQMKAIKDSRVVLH